MTSFIWRGPSLPENPFNTDDGGHELRAFMAQQYYPRRPDIEVEHLRNPSEICLLFWDNKDCYRKHHVEITDFIDNTTCVPED